MRPVLLSNRLRLCLNEGKIPRKLLLVIVVTIAAVAAGAFFLHKRTPSELSTAPDEDPPVTLLPLDEFVVNLADKAQSRYLSVTITLEVTTPPSGEEAKPKESAHKFGGRSSAGEGQASGGESDELTPRIRDAIIETLACQTYSSLRTKEGRAKLKTAIKDNVNAKVNCIRVVNVLFSTFVIQ